MKKSDINTVLKNQGIGYVKIHDGSMTGKCYTDWNGKRVKGIRGGSVGPMTATSAASDKTKSVLSTLEKDLKDLGMIEKDGHLESKDGKIKMRISVSMYPQYSRSMGYDDAYQTAYIVPEFI